MLPLQTIQEFDDWLQHRSLSFKAVVIGGAALNLLRVIDRPTRDFDVLDPEIPEVVLTAAREFASSPDTPELEQEWLNNGPRQLTEVLPEGWRSRTQVVFTGAALQLSTLGRIDLLRTKLFALCDRGTDIGDCLALRPTRTELEEIMPWLETQDAHPGWPDHVRRTLEDLAEDNDGI